MCDYPACALSSARRCEGEKNRLQMHRALGAYAEGIANSDIESPEVELQTILLFIQLLEGEGLTGRELSTL